MELSIQELPPSISDCLKTIFILQERNLKVSTSAVSANLGVSDSLVTQLFKEFANLGWVEYIPYHGVHLTPFGMQKSMEIIRHHRLLELYLARVLNYSWDKVHAEADQLEHVISEEFEEKIDALLCNPIVDPHGDPIPSKNGVITVTRGQLLFDLQIGRQANILRVFAQSIEQLQYLGQLGLFPEKQVQICQRTPFDGPLLILIGNNEHMLSANFAKQILVRV